MLIFEPDRFMIFLRTNSQNSDFQSLVKLLDAELKIRDGAEHDFYHQFNQIDHLNHVIVAYSNDIPVACGAFKPFDSDSVEVKRMYVPTEFRNKGIASALLKELEIWAGELGYTACVLETGTNQPEAIHMYGKNNYTRIPNYGQYEGKEMSVCFKKLLSIPSN